MRIPLMLPPIGGRYHTKGEMSTALPATRELRKAPLRRVDWTRLEGKLNLASAPSSGMISSAQVEGLSCSMTRPRISILTHGCRTNQYESDAMRRSLASEYADVSGEADVYILNGCTVTALAERKARQAARRLRRKSPGALVILIGCVADAVVQNLTRFDEADLIAGGAWKHQIGTVIAAGLDGVRGVLPEPPASVTLDSQRSDGPRGRVRALLKIQDGCSLACTYCRPTQMRGPSQSKSIAAAVAEAHALVEHGFPEIVLTGINIAQYAPAGARLHNLADSILRAPKLLRLRIASINPSGITDALLDAFCADARLCPHFHIPLQSGDNRVLATMSRGYTAAEYQRCIARVRNRLPHATFGADVMVGFPGEDERAFASTCAVVEHVGFSNLHIFRYSPRPGTPAACLAHPVPEAEKRRRAELLESAWRSRLRGLLDNRIGTTQDVLVEERRDGRLCGYTRDYMYASFDSTAEIPIGVERAVRITGAAEDHLRGEDDDRDGTG